MSREEVLEWLDKQIIANEILCTPLNPNDPFNVCIAGSDRRIHIYGIDRLCKLLDANYQVFLRDDECEEHYFKYKGHTFFGLVEKKDDERK